MFKSWHITLFLTLILFLSGCLNNKNKITHTPYGIIFDKTMENKKLPKDAQIFEKRKNYLPPLIAHNIKEMSITQDQNSCIACHQNHFTKNKIQSTYKNCTMCHMEK